MTQWEIDYAAKQAREAIDTIYKQYMELKDANMGILANKYELGLDANQDDILEKICDQDKYLKLAHGLLKNRMDWYDGPTDADYALGEFKVETPLDQEIYNSISPYINDWNGDGRIFRDMEWNYDRIFTLVKESNPSLYSDYQKLMEIYNWY